MKHHILNNLENLSDRGSRSNNHDGTWYTALCPAHDDRNRSLGVLIPDDDDRHVIFNCHAGCTHADVMAALGNPARPRRVVPKSTKKRTGKRGNGRLGRLVRSYVYTDENGQKLFRKNRYEPKDFRIQHLNGRQWKWGLGDCDPVLYNLPNVIAAEQVLIVEGEKDADALNALGFVATCNYDGASKDATFKPKWRPRLYNGCLADKQIVIIPDNDEAGRVHADFIAKSSQGAVASIKIVRLAGLGNGGDVSDWLAAGNDPSTLPDLINETAEYQPLTNIYGTGDNITVIDVPAGQYLSDVIDWEQLPKTISLHAGCGVGKTTAVIDTMPGKKIVAFSTVASLLQMWEKLTSEGRSVGIAYQERKEVNGQDLILTTYDSMGYVLNRINASEYSLVVDESHNVATSGDPNYRNKAINGILNLLGGAWQRVVLMTGTPVPTVHPDLAQYHHVNIASVIREQPAKFVRYGSFKLNGRSYKVRRRDALLGKIMANPEAVHVVLQNNKKANDDMLAYLEAAGLPSSAAVTLNAEMKETAVYQGLVNDGRLPDGVNILITTSLIAESVNLYTNVDYFHIADNHLSPHVMQQFVSRSRNGAAAMVYLYLSNKADGNGRFYNIEKAQAFVMAEANEARQTAQHHALLEPNDQTPEAQRARRMFKRYASNTRHYLTTDEDLNGRKFYALNYAGIDATVLADYVRYCHANPTALKNELSRFGWVFADDETGAALAEDVSTIGAMLATERQVKRLELVNNTINQLVAGGYLRLCENIRQNLISGLNYATAVALKRVVESFTNEHGNDVLMNRLLPIAANALKGTEGSGSKLTRLIRRVNIQLRGDDDPFITALRMEFADDLATGKKLTSEELGERYRATMRHFS